MRCWEQWKPAFVMIGINVIIAINSTIVKKVLDEGMNPLVLLTYQQLAAVLFIAPVAYLAERKMRPSLTVEILVYFFLSALLGASIVEYLYYIGLQYTSTTFTCAFLNMTPVFAFLIAILFRMESVDLKSRPGIAKVIGTTTSLAGAMLLASYKGIALTNALHKSAESEELAIHFVGRKWMVGTIALFGVCFCWSSWFLLQAKVLVKYPTIYSGASITFFFSFLQAAVLTLSTQRGKSIWVLKEKIKIITVLYSGVVSLGFAFLVMSWCVEKRGPVFTCAFTPLIQVMAAIINVSFFHEQLYLGSILGSILLIVGLYFLLWGKSKDVLKITASPSQKLEDIHGSQPTLV